MTKKPGFTLIELITVIGIMTIVGGIVGDVIVRSFRQNTQQEAQANVNTQMSLAIDKFNRIARSATQLITTTNTTFTILGYPKASDTIPSQISIYLTGRAVKYSVIPPSGTAPNYTYNQANAQIFSLFSNTTNNSTTTPLFQYLDDTNTVLSSPVNMASVTAVRFLPSAMDDNNLITKPDLGNTLVSLRNFKTNL